MPAAACPASACILLTLPSPPRRPPLASARTPAPTRRGGLSIRLAAARREAPPPSPADAVDCVGTGADVECFVDPGAEAPLLPRSPVAEEREGKGGEEEVSPAAFAGGELWEWASLVSPFFFWGTAMVAMKGVIPRTGPFFVAALRLLPAGALLVAFAAARGRKQPSGWAAWLAVAAFGFVDAACFQGFLAEGLQKTSAGLGSVIIDSQPLTVAILASLLFGESIGAIGVGGLVLGVVGLLLLEVPTLSVEGNDTTIWGSGEWWMLLSAQSMAVGTIMVRWVSKYSDPIMATGWHMIIGGLPLLVISVLNHDPALNGHFQDLTWSDILALGYTSIFGSAVSYGVYFYNATRGSLTTLSSLTFLTPMFACIFGYLYLGESFSPVQIGGALLTLVAIYMVNYKSIVGEK
ncbi:WAT1-related protein At3g02690, chloroplastic-like [Phragmites australis]|uniref:WAT1-related protein At3g02690, chloroplastic-like n=1 Tax=Phragmites australis TaxID=29695 RepID=UPI002D7A088E|nr:WAT1-related protein At3g02690, chloroplastic-like [Phragmites australis]